ncbi:MAG: glycogen/starch synthase [Bacteroidaceae bacterium]|nr:glycogen/starch synthase [Bacteroidaceae bacterium]
MTEKTLIPDYIFESSWEVCNKVGGIYTVLSTRAKTLQDAMPDHLIFIGPDVWQGKQNPLFEQDDKLFAPWRKQAAKEGLNVRLGRWAIPGHPIVVLVDFTPFYAQKNDIYGSLWTDFQVDSLHAYGDYDEASMFSYAAGRVVESFYNKYLNESKKVVYQAHEWMTGLGALFVQKHLPAVATIFTTHATSIGRSIAGNGKPLYDYLFAYNGNQMADELNMQSKHSIERQTAHNVDCFTTVSDVTARECVELLDKSCDVVLPNGFELDFVPKGATFVNRRRKARQRILTVANALMGTQLADDTMIVATGGRYEWKNKGIDVYLDAMRRTMHDERLKKPVLAIVAVPGWQDGPREDLREKLNNPLSAANDMPLHDPICTHKLHEPGCDHVTETLHYYGINNRRESRLHVIFAPCYLDGADGIFNLHYYDFLIGTDLTVFPSYYEPWGYTPLESIAFKVPCVTTSISGFGAWANEEKSKSVGNLFQNSTLHDGVEVIDRTDYNYDEVVEGIREAILQYSAMSPEEVKASRKAASTLAQKAQWKYFISYYYQAYDIALRKAESRKEK